MSAISGKRLHYKGSPIHKVFPGYILQGGDFTRGDGRGGESIFGEGGLKDEDFTVHTHSGPGVIAMANVEGVPNSSTSQFFVSLSQDPLPHLDGKYVVFGRLRSGWEILQLLSHYGTELDGIPKSTITISDCGVIERTSVQPRQSAPLHQGVQDFLKEKLAQLDANPQAFVMDISQANEDTRE